MTPTSTTELVDRARASDFLSAPTCGTDVADFLADGAGVAEGIGASLAPTRLVLVGSGGSLACLFTAKYLLDHVLTIPVEVVPALELRWRDPAWLGPGCLVVFNSWSGRNSDVLDALAVATASGAHTAAVVAKPTSALATGVDHVIGYTGKAIYEVPIVAVVHLALGLAGDAPDTVRWRAATADLPARLDAVQDDARRRGEEDAARLADSGLLLVLGAGPHSSLGLKLANVVMENVRIPAAYYDTTEFRHGAVEALERHRPDVLSLVGTDPSREVAGRVTDLARDAGCRVVLHDAADLGDVEPLLAPLLHNSYTQWFVAYCAFARGIDDLDERVFMGKATLSGGQWP